MYSTTAILTLPEPPAPADTSADTPPGLLLPCPQCGEDSACVSVALSDLTLHCQDCDADFDLDAVRHFIARWSAVLRWLDTMPMFDDGRPVAAAR